MNELLNRIKEHEGFRSRVYKDHLGFDTIGYGFAIKDLYLSEGLAELILREKVTNLRLSIGKKISWFDEAPRKVREVLLEMAYQMGVSGVSKFKNALRHMKNEEWNQAADEMLLSRWYKQTPKRAKELSEIIRALKGS